MADKEKKKKESILDLSKYIDKAIRVKFQGGREASGVLKGFDPLLNLVLDGTIEYMRDPDDQYKLTEDTRQLGLVVCRGTSVVLICPQDGMEAIPNPFVQQQEGNLVIVTGGYFRGDFVWYSIDWVLIYDSSQNSWTEGPPMKMSRNCHCAVAVGLHLYALGGSTDEGVTADVEMLDLAVLKWESRSPLLRPVERAAAASSGTEIYVICGRDENGDVYSGVQRLNTETNEWDVISYSPLPRYDLCASILNGILYTVGGQTLRFDLATKEWLVLNEEYLNRKFFMGCSTVNGRMFLLGQRRASVTHDIPSFVLFDPYMDICQVEDNKIPCPLPIRGCVTIRRYDVWS
uniref:U6 snRNA-associated Sm-like protein LSm7 n=2 Tax=Xenopus tropicalis TaxID=8364 RepID=A0A803JUG0_XENTR